VGYPLQEQGFGGRREKCQRYEKEGARFSQKALRESEGI